MATYPAGRVVDVEAFIAHEEAILWSRERGAASDDATPLAILFIMSLAFISRLMRFKDIYACPAQIVFDDPERLPLPGPLADGNLLDKCTAPPRSTPQDSSFDFPRDKKRKMRCPQELTLA